MKKLLALGFGFAALLILVGCEGGTTGAPENFTIAANTAGDMVVLTWEEPIDGTPDEYIVYFDEGSTGTFVAETTIQDLTFTHDPAGATGDYRIAAVLGEDEYNSEVLTTVPVATAAITLGELNAADFSGYGWDTAFAGASYSMTNAANAPSVDFYVSNWAAGYATTPYGIWAPDQGPSDPGGVVPAGSWKITAIGNSLITDPQAILPAHSATTYSQYCDMTSFPAYVAVYTVDGYYALLGVASAPNTTNGTISLVSWVQPVKGLRLIAH